MNWIFSGKQAPPRVISASVELICRNLQTKLVEDRNNNVTFELPRSTIVNGRFVIDKKIFPNYVEYTSLHDLITWAIMAERPESYSKKYLDKHLPVQNLDQNMLKNPPVNIIQATWLGHAVVLAQWDGWNILTDPIFSERCSPSQLIGPKRLRPPPGKADELPSIDVCVISHNHYDHLDVNSVIALSTAHPDLIWIVPLGMKAWLNDMNVTSVIEMDWSEKVELEDVTGKGRPPLSVQCVPCQHWCARTPLDRNKCLWASWALFTTNGSFFFAGDTGYCSMFNRLGKIFPGGISLAALPIGAYGSKKEQWVHRPNHLNPSEAVQAHIDLKANTSMGIHWGTFLVTGEHILEPLTLLKDAKKEQGIGEDEFVVFQHGETKRFPLNSTDVGKKLVIDQSSNN